MLLVELYHGSITLGLKVLKPMLGRVHDDDLAGQHLLYLTPDPSYAVLFAGGFEQLHCPGTIYKVLVEEKDITDAFGDRVELYTRKSATVIEEETDEFGSLLKKYRPELYQQLVEEDERLYGAVYKPGLSCAE